MKTQALKLALDTYGFDAAIGGARRDEEKSRAKERVFSFRSAHHRWDPRNQRPELWSLYDARKQPGGVHPRVSLSNWTELDVWSTSTSSASRSCRSISPPSARWSSATEASSSWTTIACRSPPVRSRACARCDSVRSGATRSPAPIESEATTLPAIIGELLRARTSERQGRVIDSDGAGAMELKKQEGYF